MALEGRCKRASRKAFKIGLHKFSAHVPPPLCLTDYFAEGLEPDYRDRPSSITAPPGKLAGVSGRQGSDRVCLTTTRPGKHGQQNPRGETPQRPSWSASRSVTKSPFAFLKGQEPQHPQELCICALIKRLIISSGTRSHAERF